MTCAIASRGRFAGRHGATPGQTSHCGSGASLGLGQRSRRRGPRTACRAEQAHTLLLLVARLNRGAWLGAMTESSALQPVIAPIGPSGLARRVSGRRSAPWAQPITAIASAGPAVCFGRVDWQRSRLRCGPAPAIAFASQPGKPERAQRRHSNGQTSGHGAEQRGLGCGAAEPHLHTQSVDLALFSRALVSAISAFRGVMLTPTPDLSSMALVDRIYEYTSSVASRDAALTQAR